MVASFLAQSAIFGASHQVTRVRLLSAVVGCAAIHMSCFATDSADDRSEAGETVTEGETSAVDSASPATSTADGSQGSTSISTSTSATESDSDPSDDSSSEMSELDKACKSIVPQDIQDHVDYLASDELMGRGSRTEYGLIAANYVADAFESSGLEPFGDGGTWFASLALKGYSPNVVGIVRGRTDTFVVITAHYDHLEPATTGEDRIYNGADDNASGTAALLELAQAFGQIRTGLPEASVVFIAFTAEELGLLGSKDWVGQRVIDPAKILGVVNFDMVSRNHENVIFCEGLAEFPRLGDAVEAGNQRVNLEVHYDEHPEWRTQSDHYSFIEAGIPALYFGVEDHPDYHKVTDSAEKILPKLAARVAQLVFGWVYEVER